MVFVNRSSSNKIIVNQHFDLLKIISHTIICLRSNLWTAWKTRNNLEFLPRFQRLWPSHWYQEAIEDHTIRTSPCYKTSQGRSLLMHLTWKARILLSKTSRLETGIGRAFQIDQLNRPLISTTHCLPPSGRIQFVANTVPSSTKKAWFQTAS